MKELLVQRLTHENLRGGYYVSGAVPKEGATVLRDVKETLATDCRKGAIATAKQRRSSPENETFNRLSPTKRCKVAEQATHNIKQQPAAKNFLGIGAQKAKQARSVRNAARVGVSLQQGSKGKKLSHTGSGVPLDRVIRLKYVKGFTQAVRTQCRWDDIA
jgi:hypothetical protein